MSEPRPTTTMTPATASPPPATVELSDAEVFGPAAVSAQGELSDAEVFGSPGPAPANPIAAAGDAAFNAAAGPRRAVPLPQPGTSAIAAAGDAAFVGAVAEGVQASALDHPLRPGSGDALAHAAELRGQAQAIADPAMSYTSLRERAIANVGARAPGGNIRLLHPDEANIRIDRELARMMGMPQGTAVTDLMSAQSVADWQRQDSTPTQNAATAAQATIAGFGEGVLASGKRLLGGDLSQAVYDRQARGANLPYDPNTASGITGELAGNIYTMLPMLASTPVGMALFGLSAGGDTMIDAQEQRELGREVSLAKEMTGAAGNAAVEVGMELLGQRVWKTLGRAAGPLLRQVGTAIGQRSVPALAQALGAIAGRVGVSAAQGGAEEGLTQLAQNWITRATIDPSRPITEGVGRSTLMGMLQPVAMAAIDPGTYQRTQPTPQQPAPAPAQPQAPAAAAVVEPQPAPVLPSPVAAPGTPPTPTPADPTPTPPPAASVEPLPAPATPAPTAAPPLRLGEGVRGEGGEPVAITRREGDTLTLVGLNSRTVRRVRIADLERETGRTWTDDDAPPPPAVPSPPTAPAPSVTSPTASPSATRNVGPVINTAAAPSAAPAPAPTSPAPTVDPAVVLAQRVADAGVDAARLGVANSISGGRALTDLVARTIPAGLPIRQVREVARRILAGSRNPAGNLDPALFAALAPQVRDAHIRVARLRADHARLAEQGRGIAQAITGEATAPDDPVLLDPAALARYADTHEARANRAGYRAGQLDLAATHAELTSFATERLPVAERGRVLPAIARARTPAEVRAAVEAVNRIQESYARAELVGQYRKLTGRFRRRWRALPDADRAAFEAVAGGFDETTMAPATRARAEALRQFAAEHEGLTLPDGWLAQVERLNRVPLRSLTPAELQAKVDALAELEHSIRTRDKITTRHGRLRRDRLVRQATADVNRAAPVLGAAVDPAKSTPRHRRLLERFLLDAQDTPHARALLLGGGEGTAAYRLLYRDLVEAETAAYSLRDRARAVVDRARRLHGIDDAAVRRLQTEAVTIEIGGRSVVLTRADMMGVYAYSLRAEARRKAMLNGLKAERHRGGRHTIAAAGDVTGMKSLFDTIAARLTPGERAVVEAGRDALAIMRGPANAAALKLYGHEQFREDDYTQQILVERVAAPLAIKPDAARINWLENVGFAKDLVEHSHPLLVPDWFGAFHSHTDKLARLAHLAVPVEAARQLLSDPTYRAAVNERFGRRYIDERVATMLAEVSGLTHRAKSTGERIVAWLNRNIARGLLGLNPGPVLLNRYGGAALLAAALPADVRARFLTRAASAPVRDPASTAAAAAGTLVDVVRTAVEGERGERVPAARWFVPNRDRAVVARLMTDGYLRNRWIDRPAHELATVGKEEIAGDEATLLPKTLLPRVQFYADAARELALQPMALAEIRNAIDAYRVLREGGRSAKEAVKIIANATRATQNPVSPMDRSSLVVEVSRNPLLWMVMPFAGQPNVARNMVRTAWLRWKFAGTDEARSTARRDLRWASGALAANLILQRAVWRGLQFLAAGGLLAAVRGLPGDDDEDTLARWGEDMGVDALGLLLPGADRLVVDPVLRGLTGRQPGGDLIVERERDRITRGTFRLLKELGNDDPGDEHATKIAKAAGEVLRGVGTLLLGVPVYGAQRLGSMVLSNVPRPMTTSEAERAMQHTLAVLAAPTWWQRENPDARAALLDALREIDESLASAGVPVERRRAAFDKAITGARRRHLDALWATDEPSPTTIRALLELGATRSSVRASGRSRKIDPDRVQNVASQFGVAGGGVTFDDIAAPLSLTAPTGKE